MKKIRLVCLLLSLLGCQPLFAQRIINELETNTGSNLGNIGDNIRMDGDSVDS